MSRAWRSTTEVCTRFLVMPIVVGILCATVSANAEAPQGSRMTDEYQVKAAFLYNFAKFVQWPASDDKARPFTMCVFGDDAFVVVLQQIAGGKSVQGRDLVVRTVSAEEEARACQILFIGEAEARHTRDLLAVATGWAVLTVGETMPFLRDGGLVRFYVEGNRLRFQINVEGVQQAGLKVSSQLLGIAKQ